MRLEAGSLESSLLLRPCKMLHGRARHRQSLIREGCGEGQEDGRGCRRGHAALWCPCCGSAAQAPVADFYVPEMSQNALTDCTYFYGQRAAFALAFAQFVC